MKKPDDPVSRCAALIEKASFIAALTGAGISTNAGIPDFRGPRGLYVTKKYDADRIFDIGYFFKDPHPFFEFARDFVALEKKITPTATHYFLRNLEKAGKLKGVVTQNIDALHYKAGSQNVHEMHGSIWNSCCCQCGREYSYAQMKKKLFKEKVPHCPCGGVIKPDIVFFGENVKCLDESFALAQQSDLFFVIGTSCVVFPAAMVPQYVSGNIVVVNKGDVHLKAVNIALSVQSDIDVFFKKVSGVLHLPLSG